MRRRSWRCCFVLLACGAAFAGEVALAQFVQQGLKLVGSGAVGHSSQGASVAIAADGATAIVGGPGDNNDGTGAAWVFTRVGGAWVQQGGKLVAAGIAPFTYFGTAVSLSADGNTALIGGTFDGTPFGTGAAWVFERVGSAWTQRAKLVGSDATGLAWQGVSVALSADGRTAIVGGINDNDGVGAAWVFVRGANAWTQQGPKLVGAGAAGLAGQGAAVALSADGNTAAVGGNKDDGQTGATWVFVRSGGVWTQQGSKLVGAGAVPPAYQGSSVAISADGNTLIAGGPNDNGIVGAAWVFTRNGGTWSQQGSKLVGSDAAGAAAQGHSVAISGDGNTAVVGGPGDNRVVVPPAQIGAAWVFVRSGGTWVQLGNKLVGSGYVWSPQQGFSLALASDGATAIVGGNSDSDGIGAAWVYAWQPAAEAAEIPSLGLPALVMLFAMMLGLGSFAAGWRDRD